MAHPGAAMINGKRRAADGASSAEEGEVPRGGARGQSQSIPPCSLNGLTPELASFSEGRGPAPKDQHRRAGFPCVPGGRGVPCGVPWTVVACGVLFGHQGSRFHLRPPRGSHVRSAFLQFMTLLNVQ